MIVQNALLLLLGQLGCGVNDMIRDILGVAFLAASSYAMFVIAMAA